MLINPLTDLEKFKPLQGKRYVGKVVKNDNARATSLVRCQLNIKPEKQNKNNYSDTYYSYPNL